MDDNIIISPSERAGVPSEPQTASETDIVQEEELARPPAPTIPLRFQFGASIEPLLSSHFLGFVPLTAPWHTTLARALLWLTYWWWQGIAFTPFFCVGEAFRIPMQCTADR